MNAIKGIVDWASKELQPWEADLVRRLLENGKLEDNDIKESTEYLCASHELISKPSTSPTLPVHKEDNIPETEASETVTICSIDKVVNINAIDKNSKLPFSHKGITVFYGENGSGKSGYTRILKNACYAKYVEPEILTNIYRKDVSPQSAAITFIQNGNRSEWIWKPGHANSNLSKINVYDADCGRLLLDKNNQVTYKPKGAEIFDEVSSAFEKIKEAITALIKNTNRPEIKEIEKNEESSQWLRTIGAHTSTQEIDKHTSWQENDSALLETLKKAIEDYESGATTKK